MGSSVGRVMGGTGIPVAKVLPQQATTPNQGSASVAGPPRGSHGQVRAQSPGQAADPQAPHTNVFLQRPHAGKGFVFPLFSCLCLKALRDFCVQDERWMSKMLM